MHLNDPEQSKGAISFLSRNTTRNQFVISLVFFLVSLFFGASLSHYWHNVLDPRLILAAQTQADILSKSQAGILTNALLIKDPDKRIKTVQHIFEEILLISDPSINEPFVKGIGLQLDYDVVSAENGSLDLMEGDMECDTCIKTEVALFDNDLNVLGIAQFTMTDGYYRWLSSDIKSKLFNQSAMTLMLFSLVWVMMMVLVSRLDKLRRNVEASDRAKTRFMANVSHELRTPLNAILGYTQLFRKNKELMDSQGRGVQTIHRSAEHLLTLINDILDFSKADSDTIQLYPGEVRLNDFLTMLIEMTDVRAAMKDIKLIYQFPDDLPAVVRIDEKRLRQILLNLLNNAVKFTEQGSVTFSIEALPAARASAKRGADNCCSLRFSIRDTGIGIPKNRLDDIFVAYQQVENAISSAEGSGLGLTISKKLLELMGAQLKVESTVGVGSCFSFDICLPVVQSESELVIDEKQKVISYQGEPRHVLFIDDNHFNRDVIRQTLQQWGFTVEALADGKQVLSQLQQHLPDLILLDIFMPNEDGFAVLEKIRSAGYQMPVIALTAATQSGVVERIQEGDFQGLLEKPVREEALLSLLADQLHLHWEYQQQKETMPEVLQSLLLPNESVCQALREAAAKHNVLMMRNVIADIAKNPNYKVFIEQVDPLVTSYQFGRLVELLDKLDDQYRTKQ